MTPDDAWLRLLPSQRWFAGKGRTLDAAEVHPGSWCEGSTNWLSVRPETVVVRYADGGVESALVLTVSGKLSGSYGAALTAARSLSKVLEVRVIDTKLVSAGEAIIVDAAVQARDAGMTMDEVALYTIKDGKIVEERFFY